MDNISSNISSLITPTLISSAKSQLVSQATDKIKQTVLTKADELKKKSEELIQKRKNIEVDYNTKLQKLQTDYKSGAITEEEEKQKYDQLQQQKQKELDLLDQEIKKTQDDISNSLKDPLKSAKDESKKLDDDINNSIKSSNTNQVKANTLRNTQVLRNVQKTIAPIIINQITNVLIKVASQNARLQELVDQTNAIIDSANTPVAINQARVLRNNALIIINNQEQKLSSIQNIIKTLNNIITIIQLVITLINIIFSIPKPFGPGPTMPTPIASKLNKLQILIDALGVALAITSALLAQAISQLEDLKAQLHNISDILDNKASNNIPQLGSILNINPGTDFGTYKGFKFAIREESGPGAIVVAGNKRHYAEALDTNNVAVLKSELSFTLDPNDLIDQLKLIIDSQNLIA
jgi:hypothetical protein